MRFLDLTLDDPQSNLALDEALLLETESPSSESVLRIWEPTRQFVVVGRGSRVEQEVRREVCTSDGVPILRRCSGGAAIVTGPGCLMYTLVLPTADDAGLGSVDGIHQFVLQRMATALSTPAVPVVHIGISDLAIATNSKKFSGNSMRLRRRGTPQGAALYHGTILYDFPLSRIAALLDAPPRTPDYRQDRRHADFVTNLPMSREEVCRRIVAAWDAKVTAANWPAALTQRLVAERYSQAAWNLRH